MAILGCEYERLHRYAVCATERWMERCG